MKNWEEELHFLKNNNTFRTPNSTFHEEMVVFGSNNYLGLNKHEKIQQTAIQAITQYGTGTGGSAFVTGTTPLHVALENKISAYKHVESCLLFSSGYAANVGALSCLGDRHTHFFTDRFNHASISDGIALSGAKFSRYPHRNSTQLEVLLQQSDVLHKIIVTDSVFSMDGTIAPFQELLRLAEKYDCLLVVDDAHALGVLGVHGFGITNTAEIPSDRVVIVGTLSKSIPANGGYVAGAKHVISYIRQHARSHMFSTSLSCCAVAVAMQAFDIIYTEQQHTQTLHANTQLFLSTLRSYNVPVVSQNTPIIPIIIGDNDKT
ncbi:MAG: aminotransferase class I/II-fold pyridoxal phosphate-dependent enzyme, partial [Bacilli bacterium]